MSGWKGIVGLSFSPDEFDRYCHGLQWTAWRPSFVALHNTASPTLAQRPNGLTRKHMDNLVSYYRDEKGWKAGPHLFVDDKQIWAFTPLTLSGVHSPSWNKVAIGLEMLGDYDREAFDSGRGLAVQRNAIAAIATVSAVLGLDPESMKLHREDSATTHACPGKKVDKARFIEGVKALISKRHGGEHMLVAAADAGEATAAARTARRARGRSGPGSAVPA